MNEEKNWTPGPWWVEDGTGDVVAKDGNWKICTLMNRGDENQADDAHLISSAPRMYDALEDALDILRDVAKQSGLTHSDAEACVDHIEAVMAEARGEHND